MEGGVTTLKLNHKFFEFKNHLGNVHETLSDYRRAIDDGTGEPAYYSQVGSASEYYPPVADTVLFSACY